jgi:p-aminobenzoyl-glutamate transporter AbgT
MLMLKLKSSKGNVGEDLPATIFTIILIMIFVFSVFNSYSDFFSKMDYVEQERTAAVIAEKILFDNDGLLVDVADTVNMADRFENVQINVTNLVTDEVYSKGNVVGDVSVSNVVMLILEDGKYYPSEVGVYVGK